MNMSHESFYTKIVNRYGAAVLNKVKEFTRTRIKRKKLECGLEFLVQCRDNGVVPKFAQIKPIKCVRDYDTFFRVASEKLLCRVICDYRRKFIYANMCMYELHLQLSRLLDAEMWNVLDAMTHSRTMSIELNVGKRQNNKLTNLIKSVSNQSRTHNDANINSNDNLVTVVNLSSKPLPEETKMALSRGLNFAPAPRKIPVEDIITNIENTIVRNRIPHGDAECLRQDVSSLLRKSSPPKSNMSHREIVALRNLRNNPDVLVLPADKGNATVVVDTEAYNEKITELVSDTVVYKKVAYNPTARVTTKVIKLLQDLGNKELLSRLRPHNPTPPKIYGLPKIHKPDWPLRPIVSQIDAPTYKLSRHMATTLQPYTGKTSSFIKDSRHFVTLLSDVQLKDTELMVSFDITSLFTNVPVGEVINIISTQLSANLPTGYIECIHYCLKSGYFLWKSEFYLQIDGVAMGSPIAPVVANIFMEWFENQALESAKTRPRYWWRYVDDIFAIVERDTLVEFTRHLNGIHRKIAVTVEEENNGCLPFLDVLVIRGPSGHVSHTVFRKPTHTDRYLRADSHHHPSHLFSVPRTLIDRAFSLCDPQYVDAELCHLQEVLERNGYQWRRCIRSLNTVDRGRGRRAGAERTPAFLPFVRGVTDKIGHILRRKYSIKTVYRPPGQLRQLLRSPKDKDPLGVPGVYIIPCDCGLSYIGETRRNIATRLNEHIRSMKSMDTNKSAVAEHACSTGAAHFIRFDKASVLAREKYFVPRKVREAIEISRRPNFNRDSGWTLPPAWKPALKSTSYESELSLECDTVSAVCTGMNSKDNISDTTSGGNTRVLPTPSTSSARAKRYAARCSSSLTRDIAAGSAHD